MSSNDQNYGFLKYVPFWFLAGRIILVLSLPYEGLKSYGDFWNFYRLASLGWPYIDLWVEYPPFFPLLSRGIYLLAGGSENAYVYILAILFSIVQALNVYLFSRLVRKSSGMNEWSQRLLTYSFLLVGLFYGWTYFDCIGVFLLLLSIDLSLEGKHMAAGASMGLGGLVKWFPILVFPAQLKWHDAKKTIRSGLILVGIIVLVWAVFLVVSPDFSRASLVSQSAKGSWETVWAFIDGNLGTGNFSTAADRLDPASASIPAGFPPRVSPFLTLPVFLLIGLAFLIKAELDTAQKFIAFTGLTLVLFLLWSPGYSPQWVLYVLPLVLLSFDFDRGLLVSLLLVLINLLEWPILLSRGLFQYLGVVVGLRTAILILLVFLLGQKVLGSDSKTHRRLP